MTKTKYRELHLKINEEDIKDLCATILTKIYTRNSNSINQHCEDLSLHLSNDDPKAVLSTLQQSISGAALFCEELASVVPLINQIQPDELSTYTEVLKDLSNLKKDSLGVDSGSE